MTPPPKNARDRGRAVWHRRANAVVLGYLLASIVVALIHATGGVSTWLAVHVFLLGAVTNAIVIWSAHFTATLLREPPERRRVAGRLVPLNAAVLGVLAGVTSHTSVLTVIAAAALIVVIAAHGVIVVRASRRAREDRFAVTVRFFWVAAAALVVGAGVGAALAVGVPQPWHDRLFAAHVELNVFGWIALTVLGAEFSLWPMVLRTRMVEGFETAARHALPLCAAGLALAVGGLFDGSRILAMAGLVAYALGVARALEPFVRTAVQRSPHTCASWMLTAATSWLFVSVLTDLAAAALSPDVPSFADRIENVVPWILVGFVAQVVIGALTYLLPVVLGGGPIEARRNAAVLDSFGTARTIALNAGVVLLVVAKSGAVSVAGWSLVAVAATIFVLLSARVLAGVPAARRRSAATRD